MNQRPSLLKNVISMRPACLSVIFVVSRGILLAFVIRSAIRNGIPLILLLRRVVASRYHFLHGLVMCELESALSALVSALY